MFQPRPGNPTRFLRHRVNFNGYQGILQLFLILLSVRYCGVILSYVASWTTSDR